MKTTDGKTSSPRKPRPITILRVEFGRRKDERVVAKVEAVRLRDALKKYFDDVLKAEGCWDPLFQGNTMSVKTKFHTYRFYDAVDI